MKFNDFKTNELKRIKGKRIWFINDNQVFSGLIGNFDSYQLFINNKDGISKFSLFGKHEFFYTYDELSDYLYRESINIGTKEKRIRLKNEDEENEETNTIQKISRFLFPKSKNIS